MEDQHEKLTTRCGSEEYSAPEVIMGTSHDPRLADVWSAGVVLYAILVGHLPFSEESRDVVVEESVPVPSLPQKSIIAPKKSETIARASTSLMRQLEEKLTMGSKPTPNRTGSQSTAGNSECTPQSAELSEFKSSEIAVDDNASTRRNPPAKIVRRRSTRKAGKKALWHRIARAEFSFPDEAIELAMGELKPDQKESSVDEEEIDMVSSCKVPKFPLLTPTTKELVRTILSPTLSKRPTASDLLQHEWLAEGENWFKQLGKPGDD
jgi:serine/threonine protein kinase